MRQKKKVNTKNSNYKILIVDDEIGVIESLTVVLERNGYYTGGTVDPLKAIEILKEEHYDLMILDYLMSPVHGDEVVSQVRHFNKELYILLLTGHKDLAPPIETIRSLDIQGYCEKSDRFDQLILLVESGIKAIEQMRTVKEFKDGLNSILKIAPDIYQLQPIDFILEKIVNQLPNCVEAKNVFITADDTDYSNNKAEGMDRFFRGSGNYAEFKSVSEIKDSNLEENIKKARNQAVSIKTPYGIVLPMMGAVNKVTGALYIESNKIDNNKELIETYANQAATAISNALLHSLLNTKNIELNNTYDLLKNRYMDTVEMLRLIVDAKDVYTRGHSDRVSCFSYRLGIEMGYSEEDQEILRVGGLFHDIGKVGIADKVLRKTTKLDYEEYEEIKKHSVMGEEILAGVSVFKDMLPLIRQHHERIDGKGYPDRLKGDEINPLAKIIAVADAFDAMRSDRTYRSKLTIEDTIKQLKLARGHQFDKDVVDTLLEMYRKKDDIFEEFID